MAGRKKTREQKKIARLKRQLNQSPTTRQEAISPSLHPTSPPLEPTAKKPIPMAISYNPKLIKKDLLKTLVLSLVIIISEVVLYSRLK
ncbi:MAG: hypothetical protein ABH807_02110 [Candidatus Shapirobacteria bacterium]